MFRLEKFYLLPKCVTYCKLKYIMNFKSIRVHYFVFSFNIWHINDTVKRFIVSYVVHSKDADTPLIGGFISEGWIKFLIMASKRFMTLLFREPVKKYGKK